MDNSLCRVGSSICYHYKLTKLATRVLNDAIAYQQV